VHSLIKRLTKTTAGFALSARAGPLYPRGPSSKAELRVSRESPFSCADSIILFCLPDEDEVCLICMRQTERPGLPR